MKKKHKPVSVSEDGKFNGPVLSHMRNTVFGHRASTELELQNIRSDCMRNDKAMLDAAEKKRQRKAEKAKRIAKVYGASDTVANQVYDKNAI